MGTYSITDPSGGTYQIDAPDAATAMQSFKQMGAGAGAEPLTPYQQEAQQKVSQLKGTPADPSYGPAESYVSGLTMGALPTIMAGLNTPGEMIAHRTFNPVTGYDYAKAFENEAQRSGGEEHPYLNPIANFAGGATTAAMAPELMPAGEGAGLGARVASGAVNAAAQGAATGFLSSEGLDRLTGAGEGALTGGLIGAGLPVAGAVGRSVFAKPIAGVVARFQPEDAGQAIAARAVANSGRSLQELQQEIDNATAAGQPNYTLADALGKPGADAVSNIVRSPGEAGTDAAQFLDTRQAAQGRDIQSQLSQGLGVTQTAKQAGVALKAQRRAEADVNYAAARNAPGAGAVDVSGAIQAANSVLTPGVNAIFNPASGIANNSVEAVVQRAKNLLTDNAGSQLTNFRDVFGAKTDIDSMIEAATPTQQNALMPIKNALDAAMIKASPAYEQARNRYAAQSRVMEAVPAGKAAALTGRMEDTIPAYNAMTPEAQAAYRTGYADPLMAQARGGNQMSNKALPLSNEATQAELANMSRYQGPLQPGANGPLAQALARSSRMNETYRRARTGSQTFDNLAEGEQQGLDPGVLLEAAKGNWHGVAMDAFRHIGNAYSGSTPAARQEAWRILSMRGPNADVAGALGPRTASMAKRNALMRAIGSAARGGAAISAGQNIGAQRQ